MDVGVRQSDMGKTKIGDMGNKREQGIGALVGKGLKVPDPEVPAKAQRRRFSTQYKKRILDKADGCKGVPGAIGALLRREGLYSSHLTTWRKQRERGELNGLTPKKRGRKAKPINPLARKVRELEAENRRLQKQLDKAETIIVFQKKLSEMLGIPLDGRESEGRCLMLAAEDLAKEVGVAPAYESLGVARSTLYHRCGHIGQEAKPRPKPPRALSEEERQGVLDVLHSERFVDKSPAQVWATLVDEGQYLCSERTMYRILAENQEVRERRDQLRRPEYKKPELLAQRPNEVWSWDITKLRGPVKGTYFYLYV